MCHTEGPTTFHEFDAFVALKSSAAASTFAFDYYTHTHTHTHTHTLPYFILTVNFDNIEIIQSSVNRTQSFVLIPPPPPPPPPLQLDTASK